MKKTFVFLTVGFLLFLLSNKGLSQSYQIPNGGFEMNFDTTDQEPPHWNSFMTFDCTLGSLCSFAKVPQHNRENGRPGSAGQHSLKISSRNAVLAIANGNMTMGRIHVGSSTASDPSNYNFTQRNDSNFSCLFPATVTPDSLYIWVKYTAAGNQNARVSAVIHGNTDFKDPNDAGTPSLYRGKAVLNFSPTDWTLKKIPFDYNGSCTDDTNYIIVTFTSNANPGGGSDGDALYVDDIELIYSAWLTDIEVDGQSISGFAPDIFTYDIVFPRGTNPFTASLPAITYTSEKNDVTIKDTLIMGINNSIDSARRIIQVKAEDSVTVKTYTVNFYIYKSPDAGINEFAYMLNNGNQDTVKLTDSASTVQNIHISLPPGTFYTPVIIDTGLILADTGARVISIVQAAALTPTSHNATATVTVRAENGNIKTYQVHFSVQKSSNANLAALSYQITPSSTPVPVTGFDTVTLVYHITLPPGTSNPPQVLATAQWQWSTLIRKQATSFSDSATVRVLAEDGVTQKVYVVYFTVMLDTNTNLSKIEYNYLGGGARKTITPFHPDTLSYSKDLPYGTTEVYVYATTASLLSKQPAVDTIQLPGTAIIRVVAEDTNYKKTYTVHFGVEKNDNASLSAIKYILDGDTLPVPGFYPAIEQYEVVLSPGTVSAPVLVYYLQDTNASAIIDAPASPNDTGKISVTAENGITSKTYTIAFRVALSTNVALTEIKVRDTITLFDTTLAFPQLSSYNIKLDTNLVPVITVITEDASANYKIIYPNSIPGRAQIIVTAEDTNVTKTYGLNLSFASPDNPNLVDLGYELNGMLYSVSNFHPDTLIYHVVLPSQTTQTPNIICQTADFNANATVTQPQSPHGAGMIVVVSSNEDSVKIYQVYFSVEISSNAKLDSLFYNGNYISGFSSLQQTYTIVLPYTTTLPAIVSAKAQSAAAQVDILQPLNVQDSAVVLVTAEDGQTNYRYVIHFSRQLSPVATLSALSYTLAGADSTIADFQQQVYSYSVLIAPETRSIPQLVFTLEDINASATLIRTLLQTNDTAIIRVVAENQTDSADYTIVFSRIKSANNRLSALFYNGIPVNGFHPDTLNYSIILPWGETQKPFVTAVPQWDSATVNIDTLVTVFGDVQVIIFPENGGNAAYYTVSFKRGSNVNLQELTYSLNGNTYSVDNFNANDTVYHVLLPTGTTRLPILNYVLVDNRSSVNLTNVSQPNGVGKVEITGWDSLNRKTYTVEFKVELSTEAALSDLMVDGVTIADFHTDTLAYFVEYVYGTAIFPSVTATATQPDARIDYTQINAYPGVAVIKVYAGDTNIQRVYTISFSVEAGDNAFLSDLLVDNVSLDEFDRDVFFYDVLLPYGTGTLPIVSAAAEDQRANVTITQITQWSDTAKVEVTALNGDIKEYRLYFTVDGNSNAYATNIFIDGNKLEGFNPSSRNYNYTLPVNHTGIPVVTAELADPNASYTVKDAEQIPGQTVIETVAENGRDKFSYRINFSRETSVVSFEDHINLSLYPNPGSDVINFELGEISQSCYLEIFTLEGKILGKYTLQEGINPVEIDHLQHGVYFYKVYTEKGILGTGKFIKQ
jgi:hypothetical protein